jgi:hypothetical protein
MLSKLQDITDLIQKPITQWKDIGHAKLLLEYAETYIRIAENNGCTTFDEMVMRLHGFQPLEEIQETNSAIGPDKTEAVGPTDSGETGPD